MTLAAFGRTEQEKVRFAFDEAAARYDKIWTCSLSGRLQREQVWRVLDRVSRPGDRILDLGCGSGTDAIHLAQRGARVHATDLSPEMLRTTRRKVSSAGLDHAVTTERLSLAGLADLKDRELFDGAISNFGALNCVADLGPVAAGLARVLRPSAPLLICLLGRFCLWETIWYLLDAQPRKAFRRRRASTRAALGSGPSFQVFYHSIARIARAFEDNFELRSWRGVGLFVPPPYVSLANDLPRLFARVAVLDRVLGGWPLLRASADHRLLLFIRK